MTLTSWAWQAMLHAVAVAQQADEQPADDDGVDDGVVVLDQRRRAVVAQLRPRRRSAAGTRRSTRRTTATAAAASAAGRRRRRRSPRRCRSCDPSRRPRPGSWPGRRRAARSRRAGDVVDDVVAVLEHRRLPRPERRHRRVGAAAGDELDRGVDAAHRPGDLGGEAPVLVGGLVADLPRAVHLVAETPQLARRRDRWRRSSPAGPTTVCRQGGWCTRAGRRPPGSRVCPRLTATIGSHPTDCVQRMNSSMPTWFVSTAFHARSRRTGRSAGGPMPSSQL